MEKQTQTSIEDLRNATALPEEKQKAASIMHAIEIKSNFELYAYRIISHEQFIARTKELIQFYKQETREENHQVTLDEAIEEAQN